MFKILFTNFGGISSEIERVTATWRWTWKQCLKMALGGSCAKDNNIAGAHPDLSEQPHQTSRVRSTLLTSLFLWPLLCSWHCHCHALCHFSVRQMPEAPFTETKMDTNSKGSNVGATASGTELPLLLSTSTRLSNWNCSFQKCLLSAMVITGASLSAYTLINCQPLQWLIA